MPENKPKKDIDDDEIKRQLRLIHRLAVRLPWIVVFFVVLAAIIIIIEAFLGFA